MEFIMMNVPCPPVVNAILATQLLIPPPHTLTHPSTSTSPQRQPPPQIAGSIIGLLALIGIGVGVGVSVASKNKTSSSSSSSSSPTNSDPNDPSQFTKNDALKQSLYGIAYTPEGSQLPDCGNSLGGCFPFIRVKMGWGWLRRWVGKSVLILFC